MKKTKKIFLIFALLLLCVITSICSILLYSNFGPDTQDETISGLFGRENLDSVKEGHYICTWYAVDKDGNKQSIYSTKENYEWN